MKYSENNHRTNHSLRNLSSKLDTPKDIDWLTSTCKNVGIVNLELGGSPIAGMKSSFLRKVEFNAKVVSLLNVLKNNASTLFVEKKRRYETLFLLFYRVPMCKRLRGSDIFLTSLSMMQINRCWIFNIIYFLFTWSYQFVYLCPVWLFGILWNDRKGEHCYEGTC